LNYGAVGLHGNRQAFPATPAAGGFLLGCGGSGWSALFPMGSPKKSVAKELRS